MAPQRLQRPDTEEGDRNAQDRPEHGCTEKRLQECKKLANDQLSELEHLYNSAPIGLCLMDTELRFVRINKRLAAINGKPVAEHMGKTLREVIPEIAVRLEPIYRRVIDSGEPALDFEVHGVTPSEPGVRRDWLVSYYPVKSDDGTVRGVSTVVQEITERKRTENALRDSEAKFRVLADTTAAAIFIFQGTQLCYVNSAAEIITGYSEEELLNIPFWKIIHPDFQDLVKERGLARQRGDQVEPRYEVKILTKSGEERWIDFTGDTLQFGGKPAVLGTAVDITVRKQAEFKLQEAKELLEQRVGARTRKLQQALAEVKRLKARIEAENIYLQEEIKVEHGMEEIICASAPMKEILRKVDDVAPTAATVLLLGETGTGKELVAHVIHARSHLSNRPLVKVNCAALPATLIESELFGHEKGAFTGALGRKQGRFELADGGTIFLDEIGDLPLELQVKLLRVLQSGEFERVGNSHSKKVTVRVLAATNRDLRRAIQLRHFREDLYFRLNVFPIMVPPLRERKEDIPMLANHFARKFAARLKKDCLTIPPLSMQALQNYSWPGNVRELENIIERAVIIARGTCIQIDPLLEAHEYESVPPGTGSVKLVDVEREHILRVLDKTNWIIEGKRGAAQRLGMNHGTLRSRMQKLGIKRPK
ncbi:MAG: sigma 54-interacting transcriptional regulator [bacterium]